jgi:hypothetical protein
METILRFYGKYKIVGGVMNLQLGWSTNIYYKDIKMQSAPVVLHRAMDDSLSIFA